MRAAVFGTTGIMHDEIALPIHESICVGATPCVALGGDSIKKKDLEIPAQGRIVTPSTPQLVCLSEELSTIISSSISS